MRTINIFHLYPGYLNLYGDRGNILALYQRAYRRGINVNIIGVDPGGKIDLDHCDLLFMGGGQDSDQKLVAEDLKKRDRDLKHAVENGMPILAVCGSYQLLGHYYTTVQGENIAGLEIIDLYTEPGRGRLIGNALVKCSLWEPPQTLAGFENHAGRTYLGPETKPLGKVIKGYGNNGSDKTEGAVYKNVIGTYLHGALLPKNPWMTDYLLQKALTYRHQDNHLEILDDFVEIQAHNTASRLAGLRRP